MSNNSCATQNRQVNFANHLKSCATHNRQVKFANQLKNYNQIKKPKQIR